MSVNMIAASLRCSPAALMAQASRLCKRCAVSARRRSCDSSCRFSRHESFDQLLKARIAAQRVEPLVGLGAAVVALQKDTALVEALLEQPQRFLFLTQDKVDDRERVGRYIMLP